MNCIVVDDEPIGREGLADYITEIEHLKLVGLCKDAVEASNLIHEAQVDLIFLDIQMPKLTGLEFLRSLKNPPLIIICTAYPSYALEGYDLNVLDYLVKPVTYQRFLKAYNKAKSHHQLLSNAKSEEGSDDFFFIKSEHKYVKICMNEILFIESLQNYVKIHCMDNSYITLLSLKSVLTNLPESNFKQVHKSYIVNMTMISGVDGNQLIINDRKVPISRSLKTDILNTIFKDKLLKN